MKLSKEADLVKSNKLANYLSLFTSSGTIVCCALPALLVSIGAGAALSSLIAVFPQLVILSVYKIPIFMGAFVMLIISGILQYLKTWHMLASEPEKYRWLFTLHR